MKNTDKKSPLKELFVLEKMRKSVNAKEPKRNIQAIFGALFLVCFIGLYVLVFAEQFGAKISSKFFFVFLVVAILVGYFAFRDIKADKKIEDKEEFSLRYKDFYLKKYVNSLGFEYEKQGNIDRDIIYHLSNLFPRFDICQGNDFIKGKIDNVEFEFCDLLLKETTTMSNGVGIIIFEGLLFVAKFNKNTKGRIVITPKNIANKDDFEKIKMDNSEFNDTFNVFTTDLQNAMYVLTPALMDRILELKKIMKCPISLSFLYDRIFIKIDKGYDSFEPDLNKSIVSTNIARHIKIELDAMFNIVKILKLNNRIWILEKN